MADNTRAKVLGIIPRSGVFGQADVEMGFSYSYFSFNFNRARPGGNSGDYFIVGAASNCRYSVNCTAFYASKKVLPLAGIAVIFPS